MFMIEIAGLKILYTGDYSREEERHLVKAEVPPVKPDVMICESTFGVHTFPDRKEKEEALMSKFNEWPAYTAGSQLIIFQRSSGTLSEEVEDA